MTLRKSKLNYLLRTPASPRRLRSSERSSKTSRSRRTRLRPARRIWRSAFQGIAAAGALLGIAKIGKDAFDSAVGISQMADKTGLTTQTLSVFHKVAGDVGASTEGVDKALIKAAKSITEFQQGTGKSASAFAMLKIAQKDFVGLSPDQKIKLVTERLGGMAAGFQKSTAQALIFGKGASDITLVANSLAAQGFDKASAATSKLGLLLDRNTTDSFIAAKASMQELEDTGKGMATQFEAAMLPGGFRRRRSAGGFAAEGRREFSGHREVRGRRDSRHRGCVFGARADARDRRGRASRRFLRTRSTRSKTTRSKLHGARSGRHGRSGGRLQRLEPAPKGQTGIVDEEVAKQKAIYGTLRDSMKEDIANVFPDAAEEARRKKARIANLRPDADDTTPENSRSSARRVTPRRRRELSLEEKMLQDQLAIHRAYAKETETVDKEMYDAGLISLKEYFDRRKAAAQTDADEEIAILQRERARRSGGFARRPAPKRRNNPQDPRTSDKLLAEQIARQGKSRGDRHARSPRRESRPATKIHTLNTEQDKARARKPAADSRLREASFTNFRASGSETAQTEIERRLQNAQLQIDQSSGSAADKAKLTAELEQWKQLKLAVADYDQARQKLEQDTKAFETARQESIQNKAAGDRSPSWKKSKQINQLIKDRLPLLKADAAAETGAAAKTGNVDLQAEARRRQAGVHNLTVCA